MCSIKTCETFTECYSVIGTKQDFQSAKKSCEILEGKLASEDLKDGLLANLLKNSWLKMWCTGPTILGSAGPGFGLSF